MANWNKYTIRRIIEDIESKKLLLPVIQRELVWDEEKVISLFQTLCIGDSYGGIMTVLDEKGSGRDPMFDIRYFEPNYAKNNIYESQHVGFMNQNIEYVIDGQQRLSSILMGVRGSYNGKILYFDLLGDYRNNEYVFEFSREHGSLPRSHKDEKTDMEYRTWWMSVPELNNRFASTPDKDELIDLLIEEHENVQLDNLLEDRARKNIGKLFTALRIDESVGVCQVHCILRKKGKDNDESMAENRMRIVNLFRKLNQGGTVLSGIELMRSMLKALSSENERFLNVIKDKYADIGLDQDGVIKFIFLLQDKVSKEITDVSKNDSDFITANKERIFASLDALGRYLVRAKLFDYVKKWRPSTIPLYLLAYYLYHLPLSDAQLREYFEGDVHTDNVRMINRWMRISLLNRVFQRGRGWNPDRTGRRLIHQILQLHKGDKFPIAEIFELYTQRLHWFDECPKNEETRLNDYERSFVFYSVYGADVLSRRNDADHIIAKHLLEERKVTGDRINTISNFQLLYYRENRSKQDEEFREWVHRVFNEDTKKIDEFTTMHCIPKDESLWVPERYDEFCAARRLLLIDKLKS